MDRSQRLVLIISILASFVAFLDSSVVNVALPTISRELGGGLMTQQWVTDAYLITLGSLMLLAGSLSDLFGQKRILVIGLIGFATTSTLCAVASNSVILIMARALQGCAGALLVPNSLALIISTFSGSSQGKAIGRWTAWTGISFIVGPLLGGFLVDTASWRFIFAINVIPIAICLSLLRVVKRQEGLKRTRLDIGGASLCSFGLGCFTFGLIEQPHYGWHSPFILGALMCGLALLAIFIWYESRSQSAMLPLSLFAIGNFWVGNVATLAIYGGLSIATFLLVIFLQQVGSYSAFFAGFALLPVTIVMFLLSPRFGAMSSRNGPRLFMATGPIIAGLGFLLMLRVTAYVHYWSELLPGLLVFALGLSMTVAPLTAAVLADVGEGRAGIASAINNAVARIAGLIMIAFVGVIVGSRVDVAGFHRAILFTALLVMAGGLISAVGIRNRAVAKM
jgi:EmrB/QacA subfamily drug resistance transporter